MHGQQNIKILTHVQWGRNKTAYRVPQVSDGKKTTSAQRRKLRIHWISARGQLIYGDLPDYVLRADLRIQYRRKKKTSVVLTCYLGHRS